MVAMQELYGVPITGAMIYAVVVVIRSVVSSHAKRSRQ